MYIVQQIKPSLLNVLESAVLVCIPYCHYMGISMYTCFKLSRNEQKETTIYFSVITEWIQGEFMKRKKTTSYVHVSRFELKRVHLLLGPSDIFCILLGNAIIVYESLNTTIPSLKSLNTINFCSHGHWLHFSQTALLYKINAILTKTNATKILDTTA